jgi:hypothetical protein
MSKWLTVVALVLLVLTGAVGLRNIVVANAATVSSFNNSTPVIWANGPGPYPPPLPTGKGGHIRANGPGPYPPPLPTGKGGHVRANGPGPYPPPLPTGKGGHVRANGIGSINSALPTEGSVY